MWAVNICTKLPNVWDNWIPNSGSKLSSSLLCSWGVIVQWYWSCICTVPNYVRISMYWKIKSILLTKWGLVLLSSKKMYFKILRRSLSRNCISTTMYPEYVMYGYPQVKCRLLISSIFDAMNFQHFSEML